MINWNKNVVSEGVIKYSFKKQNGLLDFTFHDFMRISKHDSNAGAFVQAIKRALEDSQWSLKAYFWECPPVSWDSTDRQFEFVTVQAPSLSNIRENYKSFEDIFHRGREKYVTSFLNLGRDAVLVAPVPERGKDFSHLAKFNSKADDIKIQKFWEKVAEKLENGLDNKAGKLKWLSTNGLGVHYLHVRIDDYPKYYQYQPYKVKSETRHEIQIKSSLGHSEDSTSRDSKHFSKQRGNDARESGHASPHNEHFQRTQGKPVQSRFRRNENEKAQTTYEHAYSGHGQSPSPESHGQSSLPGNDEQFSLPGSHEQSSLPGNHGQSSLTGNHGQSSLPGSHGQSSLLGNHGQSHSPGNHGQSHSPGSHGQSSLPGSHESRKEQTANDQDDSGH